MRDRSSGAAHGSWKGGRVRCTGGYWRIRLERTDPLYIMSDRSGYVLEHRLVLARYLGRPLTANETVHHINGDGSDNRVENLQLRQGKHGKGVAMQCLDCGSHNVEARPLAAENS